MTYAEIAMLMDDIDLAKRLGGSVPISRMFLSKRGIAIRTDYQTSPVSDNAPDAALYTERITASRVPVDDRWALTAASRRAAAARTLLRAGCNCR